MLFTLTLTLTLPLPLPELFCTFDGHQPASPSMQMRHLESCIEHSPSRLPPLTLPGPDGRTVTRPDVGDGQACFPHLNTNINMDMIMILFSLCQSSSSVAWADSHSTSRSLLTRTARMSHPRCQGQRNEMLVVVDSVLRLLSPSRSLPSSPRPSRRRFASLLWIQLPCRAGPSYRARSALSTS